jgi:hypothetical protein
LHPRSGGVSHFLAEADAYAADAASSRVSFLSLRLFMPPLTAPTTAAREESDSGCRRGIRGVGCVTNGPNIAKHRITFAETTFPTQNFGILRYKLQKNVFCTAKYQNFVSEMQFLQRRFDNFEPRTHFLRRFLHH